MTTLDARAEVESLSSIERVIYSASDQLSNESVVKMVFLFSDLLIEEELLLLLNTSAEISKRIYCVVKLVLSRKRLPPTLAVNVWAELLFLTKNYHLLRPLNTCKHKMREQTLREVSFFSSEFRRYLVSLADEMTDDDVEYIWRRLNTANTDCPPQPELLFHHMLREKLITEENLKELQVHFGVLDRPDLQSRTEQYLEKAGIRLGKFAQYDLEPNGTTGYCGLALIFNNKNFKKVPPPKFARTAVKSLETRTGTDRDAERLKDLWGSFGIQACVYPDTDFNAFEKHLTDCLEGDLSSVKIVIICILSHGREGEVFCADGVPVQISDIEVLLGNNEKLARKPKLLFVQACQGHVIQKKGSSTDMAEDFEFDARSLESDKMPVPQFSDMLIGIATVPGFMSIRSKTEGSHFIQTLVDVLESSGEEEDMSSLVTEINHKVAHKWVSYKHKKETLEVTQMPSFRNQLTKRLRFKRTRPVLQV